MASLLPNLVSVTAPSNPIHFRLRLCSPSHGRPPPRRRRRRLLRSHFSTASASKEEEPSLSHLKNRTREQPPRTLFPGGLERPAIQVPTVVLQLDAEEVLGGDEDVVSAVDKAVSKPVGIVVLGGGEGSGGRLYEAACLLKSVIRDRAYLLIAERVDIAAAVNASGVVLSDHGLPAIVARCMMMDSKPESVVLPLVGRRVQTENAALNASNSEGADFLIYSVAQDMHDAETLNSVIENVKIPIFFMVGKNTSVTQKSHLCSSGVSGFVISLEVLRLPIDSVLGEFLDSVSATDPRQLHEVKSNYNRKILGVDYNSHSHGKMGIGSFIKLGSKEKQLLETESSVLLEAINVIQEAAPLMKEVSLLIDAVSQLDEPFLLAIVGEFNSGKSSVINALLGRRYLKEGVIPTTNEITFLCHSSFDSDEKQHCEWHPDGRFICYLPAPILRQMTIVDTPGTNVILKRQQRLTEEFIPRADLLLFVMSADRPLTESEVTFLRYAQRWKKKVVFVLNKSDLYQNAREHKEAISFVKENAQKLLNTEQVTLFSVSARSALEAKLLDSSDLRENLGHISSADSLWRANGFDELEKFLYSFIDGSTKAGIERIRLKLETPIGIADHMLSACDTIVRKECQYAQEDLFAVNEIVSSVRDFKMKMQSKSISWRGQTLSLVNATKARVVKVIESTLQLSNLDLIASYVFKGDKSSTMPASSTIQNDIIGPALSDTQKLLAEYALWLETNSAQERRLYKESFERRWPSFVYPQNQVRLKSTDSLKNEVSLTVINNFSVSAASKLFEQEIREVFLGTFGGLGVAGLSASLLTSVLPTTLEDLFALGLCSTGGYLAISKFPARRQEMVNKVVRTAESLACKLEEAMQKDLLETVEELENFVRFIGKPHEEAAQNSLDRLSAVQGLLSDVDKKVRTLRVQIQNLHVS